MDLENTLGLVLLQVVIVALHIAAMWKVFRKAGKPGWASLIPFYNLYILLKIAGKPGWWLMLFFIPFVNIYVYFSLSIGLAKAFNRSTLFGIFVIGFLQLIGYLILGFGKSSYTPGTIVGSKMNGTEEQEDISAKPPLISPEDQTKNLV